MTGPTAASGKTLAGSASHARSSTPGGLSFEHPFTGERVSVEEALPGDLEEVLSTARRDLQP